MTILTSDQILRLHSAISGNFSDLNLDLDLLRPIKNWSMDDITGNDQGRFKRIHALINLADNDGWIVELIEQAQKARPDVEAFANLIAEISGSPLFTVQLHPIHDALVVNNDQPFLNRHVLKEQLDQLDVASRQVLVITGGQGSGKTYSRKLISYLRKIRGFKVILCDCKLLVSNPSKEELTPEILGEQIALKMGLNPPPRGDEAEARWVRKFIAWLEGKLNNDPKQYWIIVDHIDKVMLSMGTKDLIQFLVISVDLIPTLRLILLGYDQIDDIETDGLGYDIASEDIQPIGADELLEFFKGFYQQLDARYEKQHDLQDAINSTARVLHRLRGQVDLNSPRMLKLLKDETTAEVRRILEPLA